MVVSLPLRVLVVSMVEIETLEMMFAIDNDEMRYKLQSRLWEKDSRDCENQTQSQIHMNYLNKFKNRNLNDERRRKQKGMKMRSVLTDLKAKGIIFEGLGKYPEEIYRNPRRKVRDLREEIRRK